MSEVLDLDILKPPARIVKLNGIEFDVSFVPTGITFEVDGIVRELEVVVKAIEEETGSSGNDALYDAANSNSEHAHKAYELGVRLCVAFCHEYPEMDEDWFMKNTSPTQVGFFSEAIQEALVQSYKGVAEYQKKTK